MQTSVLIAACYDAACRPPTSGGTGGSSPKTGISHIRGDIARERRGILKELDAQGVAADHPLRAIFQHSMGNKVLVVRNDKGEVVGGVQYDVSRRDKTLHITDMRMAQERSGHGTEAFKSMARIAKDDNLEMTIYGAIESAKPFYAKMGAVFQKGSSIGHFTKQARDALAEGMPVPGHANLPYEDWVKIDFACHDASCRPPTAGGTGGSSPARPHGVPFKTANGWSITAADGTVLKATFSKTNPPYDPDPNSDIDNSVWDTVAKDALRGLMHSYDLAPIDKVPSIVLGDYTTHPGMLRQYQDMIDQLAKKNFTYRDAQGNAVTAEDMAGLTSGFMYPRGAPDNALPPGTIGIMASKRQYDNAFTNAKSTTSMPESLAVPEMEYVAAHEYGHHRYWNGPDGIPRYRAATMYQIYRRDAAMSEYGQTNEREAHAEAFAAWVTNEAMGLPQRQVTKDYQDEFGWGEPNAPRGRGLSFELDEDASDVVAVYDTEYGPIYVHKNGSVRFDPVDSEDALQADSQVRTTASHRPVPPQDSNRIELL